MRKRWYFTKKGVKNIFQSQMDESNFLEEIKTWEHIHLGTASTNSTRKSRRFSGRIRRVFSTTSRLIFGFPWSDKWLLVHVRKLHIPPSRWTKSQTLLAERRITPCSTEIFWRIQNYSYEFRCQAREDASMIIGILMGEERDLSDPWTGFTQFTLLEEKPPDGYTVVRGEINKKTADIQARSFMARTLGENGKECQAEREAKVVTWKTSTR